MPPDPPRSSTLRASLLPLRGNYISHSIQTKNLGIYGLSIFINCSLVRSVRRLIFAASRSCRLLRDERGVLQTTGDLSLHHIVSAQHTADWIPELRMIPFQTENWLCFIPSRFPFFFLFSFFFTLRSTVHNRNSFKRNQEITFVLVLLRFETGRVIRLGGFGYGLTTLNIENCSNFKPNNQCIEPDQSTWNLSDRSTWKHLYWSTGNDQLAIVLILLLGGTVNSTIKDVISSQKLITLDSTCKVRYVKMPSHFYCKYALVAPNSRSSRTWT